MTEASAAGQIPVVTIDGPSGSGKGTIASLLAERLGWHLLDSGALYRVVAAEALRTGVSLEDEAGLGRLAGALDIRFDGESVWVDGRDLGVEIRTEVVSEAASIVAALAPVRAAILALQRGMRRAPGLVADGRDMGTVVFADAPLKIYLDASVEARAERRYNQLKNKGLTVSLRALLASLKDRDERDRARAVSPLVPARDAIVIDSTEMSIDAVLSQIVAEVEARQLRESA
ncbi:MAG: (d)CMP kinase [Pseudomonadales bacterium]|nr:(d)CMP kinase [Pseudomonadales bacterium]